MEPTILGTAWEWVLEKEARRRRRPKRRRRLKRSRRSKGAKGIFGMLGGPRQVASKAILVVNTARWANKALR